MFEAIKDQPTREGLEALLALVRKQETANSATDSRLTALSGTTLAAIRRTGDTRASSNKGAPSTAVERQAEAASGFYTIAKNKGIVLGAYDTGSYLEVEADGTLQLYGDATAWDDLRVNGTNLKAVGASVPTWTAFRNNGAGSTGTYSWAFGVTKLAEVHFCVQFPHSWAGTTVHPHVHFSPSTAVVGGVYFAIEYTWANIDETFPTTSSVDSKTYTSGTAYSHQIAEFSPISPSASQDGISSMLIGRFYRDPGNVHDVYASNVFVHEIDFHFEIDTLGSREEYTK